MRLLIFTLISLLSALLVHADEPQPKWVIVSAGSCRPAVGRYDFHALMHLSGVNSTGLGVRCSARGSTDHGITVWDASCGYGMTSIPGHLLFVDTRRGCEKVLSNLIAQGLI